MLKLKTIGQDVKETTGIEFEKYRKPEIIDTLLETTAFLTNPISVISVFLKNLVMVCAILNFALVAWCYMNDVPFWIVLIFFATGNLGFPVVGLSLGVMDVIKKLADDLIKTLQLAMDLNIEVMQDVSQLRTRPLPPVSDLTKGVVLVVMYPSIRQIVLGKVGFIGKPFLWILEWILLTFTTVFDKVVEQSTPTEEVLREKVEQADNEFERIGRERLFAIITKMKPLVETIVRERVLPTVFIPLRMVFYGSAVFTLLMVLLLDWALT